MRAVALVFWLLVQVGFAQQPVVFPPRRVWILSSNKVQRLVVLENGRLCDVAPTVLALMGIEKPKVMTGHSLLKKG